MERRFAAGLGCALLWLSAATWPGEDPLTSPAEVVESFQQVVVLHAGRAPDRIAVQAVGQGIDATHDMGRIARMVLGGHWAGLDEDQRRTFTKTFTVHSAVVWLSRFAAADEVAMEVCDETVDAGRARVEAVIVDAAGQRIPLIYQLVLVEAGWRIVNVLAEGVSDLALRRTDYGRRIDEQGFEGLLKALREEVCDELAVPAKARPPC